MVNRYHLLDRYDSQALNYQNYSGSKFIHMLPPSTTAPVSTWQRSAVCWTLILAGLLGVALTGVRISAQRQTPGPYDPENPAFCDFHNGVYFPALAFSRGDSPYSQQYAESYTVERSIPFFSPIVLAWHTPLTWLPLPVAEVVYFAWMLVLIGGIALLTSQVVVSCWPDDGPSASGGAPGTVSVTGNRLLREVKTLMLPTGGWRSIVFWFVICFCIYGRGGQQTLFTGYFTFELVLASLIAVHSGRRRPWLSGLALVVVSAKPNYVLPIGLLMLCRGHWRAVLIGGVLSAVSALACFYQIMPDSGWAGLLEQIQTTQEIHRSDPYEMPERSWLRIDALAIVAKWTGWLPGEAAHLAGMILCLLPIGGYFVVRRVRGTTEGGLETADANLLLLASLIAIYHQVYDALLLIPLVCVLARSLLSRQGSRFWGLKRGWQWLVLGLCLLPQANYLSSYLVLQKLQMNGWLFQLVTSLNGIGLVIALAILSYGALHERNLLPTKMQQE